MFAFSRDFVHISPVFEEGKNGHMLMHTAFILFESTSAAILFSVPDVSWGAFFSFRILDHIAKFTERSSAGNVVLTCRS